MILLSGTAVKAMSIMAWMDGRMVIAIAVKTGTAMTVKRKGRVR
jgi:hypothetical protein